MLPRRLSSGISPTPRGAMNNRIQLMRANSQRDTNGEFLPDVVFAECWASISKLASKYTEKSEIVTTEATHKIVISYRPGVTTVLKILFQGRLFLLEAVFDPDEHKNELWLFAYERNDGVV